jgi:DNA-binding PadR family transcriptional regulator
VTRVQSDVNVPFVRFKEYLDDLQRKGLIEVVPDLGITERGRRYLQEYRRVRDFFEQFGLSERRSGAGPHVPLRDAAASQGENPRDRRSKQTGSSSGDKV